MNALLAAMLMTAQPAPAEPYRIVGGESPWTLTVERGRMTYEAPGRETISEAAAQLLRDDANGTLTYRTSRLSAFIMPGLPCAGADGRRYTDAVFVTVGREELSGCGGALLAADSLAGTSWLLVEIGGEATELTGDLLHDDRFMIDFHIGGFVGYGGCNRISGGYTQSGDLMTANPPWGRGTRNCGDPVTARETRLLRILAGPVRISRPDAETMVLAGEAGTIRLRRVHTEH